MARGYIYHITTTPDNLGCIDASDFFENLDALSAQYVEDVSPDNALVCTSALRKELESDGFPIVPDTEADEDGRDTAAFIIKTGNLESLSVCKMRYFEPLLEALKKEVAALELATFASYECGAHSLTSKINDDYGDVVYLEAGNYGGSTYTMHEFIRQMNPDTTYYVAANVVLMK